MIRFKQEACGDLETALRREWLETNGLGGFASSTIIGLNTRRYHGLLVAATKPPVGRLVLLSKLEETLSIDGKRFDLSANRYPGVIHPQGFSSIPMDRVGRESGNANGHVFSPLRGAVTDPLALPRDHGLTRLNLQHAFVMFDVQSAV